MFRRVVHLGQVVTVALLMVAEPAPRPLSAVEPQSQTVSEAATSHENRPLLGFSPGAQEQQRHFEQLAVAVPQPDKARRWMHALTEEPHVAGTPADYKTALYVRDRLRDMGLNAELEEYDVLLNYPVKVSAVQTVPERRQISLREEGDLRDKDSFSAAAFPAFHGYGASGTAGGQVVYVNYARVEDFKKLDELDISVEGRIVLARYGHIFRGLKVQNAQQHGAAGVLLYSDPADDGYMRGDVYPNGPFRPESAIQRGSVQFLSVAPGDPTTPGWASTVGAKRIKYEDLKDIARIPSLPISYAEAAPILKAIAGPEVPDGWQGGLPFAYHVGPGPAEVELSVEMDYAIRPIWNVMATIPGTVEPDRWVMFCNHRDAWTYGAVDPNSGSTAWLETIRALSEALKAGWKPRRSILLASWDGEEYGLLGSIEYGEQYADRVRKNAVMVLNVDSAVSGPNLDIAGVPSLRDLVLGAAADVNEPRSGKPLAEVWLKAQRRQWAESEPVPLDKPDVPFVPQLGAVGSGSDYTVFLDHLGVPILDVDFGGRYGVYHSIYDNLFWMENFCDPEYAFHTAAAKLYTLIVMRAGTAEVVPMRFVPYGEAIAGYRDDLKKQLIRKQRLAEVDGKTAWSPDFSAVDEGVNAFKTSAKALDDALTALGQRDDLPGDQLPALNDAVARIERTLTDPDGLPERPWFQHLVYAPGLTTGYACWPLPGLRQAVEQDNPDLFAHEAPRLAAPLHAAADAMRAAAEVARSLNP